MGEVKHSGSINCCQGICFWYENSNPKGESFQIPIQRIIDTVTYELIRRDRLLIKSGKAKAPWSRIEYELKTNWKP
jgi:hypothetical protein